MSKSAAIRKIIAGVVGIGAVSAAPVMVFRNLTKKGSDSKPSALQNNRNTLKSQLDALEKAKAGK